MSKQETDLPGCGHEMMSERGWFNRAAHSLPLVRYSPSHPFPRIAAVAYPAPFSEAHFIVPPRISLASLSSSVPWVRLPHRRHLSSPRVIIASLVPLVVSSGREAGRGEVIRIVSSARRGQASRRAGRGHASGVLVSWRA